MELVKNQEVSNKRKQSIIFFLVETNSVEPYQEETELGICIKDGNEQIDFGFSRSETDMLISYLKAVRKNIIQRDKIKTA
ncbi:hypothetical protein JCM19294_1148 [Nonlabens tegetincola]|uniref:Uncharacterized protein n=1 Tax=Nonlabens tegetincola TaxID=323273 RepID=A0A090Q173_9FLAO|nr:hypothetical protein [Nonlabens tegetincola]GAK96839.1 hypothetical protein JCM19294_1148 [Nonlabens tegetincola]